MLLVLLFLGFHNRVSVNPKTILKKYFSFYFMQSCLLIF